MVTRETATVIVLHTFLTSPLKLGPQGQIWPIVVFITLAVLYKMQPLEIERLWLLGASTNNGRVTAYLSRKWRFSMWILCNGEMVRIVLWESLDQDHKEWQDYQSPCSVISATDFPTPISRHAQLYFEDTFLIMGGDACTGCNSCTCTECETSDIIYQLEIE